MPSLPKSPLLAAALICLPFALGACDPDAELEEELAASQGDLSAPPLAEPCEMQSDARECAEGEGTQFCAQVGYDPEAGPSYSWGECLSDFECMPGESKSCGLGEEFGDISQPCVLDEDGVPGWMEEACNTPLVLSFDGGPVEMTRSSASFDISGAGLCFDTDWPAARNPWLALDLDGNGHIDGGHELFGSGSVLASGAHARNGFIALATLDSNADGRIDAGDARYGELLVWRDEDGDKHSLPWELSSLAQEGVESIELGYGVAESCDERGNCGRERSSFEFVRGGERRTGEVVDVYLACQ